MIRANKGALKRLDNLVAGARARAAAGPTIKGVIVTQADAVTAGPLTGTTTPPATPVAAFDLTPTRSGVYLVTMTIGFVLSAADTVTWALDAIPAVTAISGGATVQENFHYETTGSALVVTGGTPVNELVVEQEIAAGQITFQTVTLAGFVGLAALDVRSAIELLVFTAGGAHLTALGIANAGAVEL